MPIELPVTRRTLSPTDVSQYIRLDRCERFLRLRMHERSEGREFLEEFGVSAQGIPPLMTRSGGKFEAEIANALRAQGRFTDFSQEPQMRDGQRLADNGRVVEMLRLLAPGQARVLGQPRLTAALGAWHVRGDVDLLRIGRDADGRCHVLIADTKSSTAPKVEHRLQVAFYHAVLKEILTQAQIEAQIETGILYRGPADGAELEELAGHRTAALESLGLEAGFLERVADPDAYLYEVRDLIIGPDSAAERIARLPFEGLFFTLNLKCDGCHFNEFCIKESRERNDLSLLSSLTGRDKRALLGAGVRTVADLAALKELRDGTRELTPLPGREATLQALAPTSAGPRLDELILRARRRAGLTSLSYLPSKGHSTLPYTSAEHNPNLISIYIDAQHDYLHDRTYLIGALVVAHENGVPVRQRSVVHLTDGPPDTAHKEAALFGRWVWETLAAVVELAAPDTGGAMRAPIHLIFWNDFEQRLLLDALARNFSSMLTVAPALYDFVTQIAAFDSPLATFLDAEIREHRNYPMLCQSLQAVASYLGFEWGDDRQRFRERLFDGLQDGQEQRSRHNSQIPLEYAYAAWGELPEPKPDGDTLAAYRGVGRDHLLGFQARRLEAIEHICRDFSGNKLTEKTAFALPDLATFSQRADHLAGALSEFVTIERHVELAAWKSVRQMPPERRALLGETLLVRYCEDDQDPEVALRNRANEHRRLLQDQYRAEYRTANPDAKQVRLPRAQKEECDWTQENMTFRLRLETQGLDCDLETLLGLVNVRPGDYFILYPRFAYDERLPLEERMPNTPTPKQMLYGTRAELVTLSVTRDTDGLAVSAFAEVQIKPGRGGPWSKGFLFPSIDRSLVADALYTLDSDPNDIYGYWGVKVTDGLCALADGEASGRHALYDRLAHSTPAHTDWPPIAQESQARFLQGLDALRDIGALHDFEAGKRAYIGEHGTDPILLVQGPPGTGKSYSTAFAVLARLQGALALGRGHRVFLSCKTHSATDVLLHAVLEVREQLRGFRQAHPDLWNEFFDARLLSVPLLRMAPKTTPPDGIAILRKDAEREKGEPKCADEIQSYPYAIIGATPGGIYTPIKDRWDGDNLFGHFSCDLLVLDEASQMGLPEAMMAALPLKPDGQMIVVGDPRQMPPIVKHDWDAEPRRTFQEYRAYASLFETLLPFGPPIIKFEESFRLHATMAEFLRQEIYQRDGIPYHSRRTKVLASVPHDDPFLAAVLSPGHPLIIVVHDEDASQTRNAFELALIGPILQALAHPDLYGLGATDGLGVVVPHRAQRVALRQAFPELSTRDETGAILVEAVDTVERYQGEERDVILVSATESDAHYLQASAAFLLDPRRLTVALSRAKKKMILVASRSVFSYFSTDETLFQNSQIWKNLLRRTCTVPLWEGERHGQSVQVWGSRE